MSYIIDQSSCTRCGVCADICPTGLIGKNNDGSVFFKPERIPVCLLCGHCMAVCATKSVVAGDLSYEKDFRDLSGHAVNYDLLMNFFDHRRSVRFFNDKPVEKEALQKVIDAIASAPYGVNPQSVHFTVISDRNQIKAAAPVMSDTYKSLGKVFPNPLIRWIMKILIPPDSYNTLKNFIIPHTQHGLYINAAENDDIARSAPAMILFHAHKAAEEQLPDSHIYLTYAFLAAHALGLGATVIGLIPPAVNRDKKLRGLFQIPKDHTVITCLILGYPRYHFRRAIVRPRINTHWL